MNQIEAKISALSNTSRTSAALSKPNNQTMVMERDPNSYQCTTSCAPAGESTSWRFVIDLESSPGSLPILSLHPAVPPCTHLLDPAQRKTPVDIISRGLVTLENARKYHSLYQDRLDHFLYGVLGDHSNSTFEHLQQASPILSTVVCAVGALHCVSADYEPLRQEFMSLSSAMLFSRNNTVDHVRAFCIGAFWISDLSTSLVSIAVRIATELQLSRSFTKALQGDRDSYLRARLHYLVYACDHHLSVPHGRPPLTRECDAVQNVRSFLDCKYANHDDARLVSHVLRWRVWTEIFDTLSQRVDRPLSNAEIPLLKRFSNALDSLRVEWTDRLGSDQNVGNYPWKGVGMQHHFAKLYLYSHIFRGHDSEQIERTGRNMDLEMYEMASSAVLSAMCILRTVTSDLEMQSYLNGLPTYFHVMIAFAVVFMLRVSARSFHFGEIDTSGVKSLMTKLTAVLQEVSKSMHSQHLMVTITECTKDAVQRCYSVALPGAEDNSASAGPMDYGFDNHHGLFDNEAVDQFFNEYGFLVDTIPKSPALDQ